MALLVDVYKRHPVPRHGRPLSPPSLSSHPFPTLPTTTSTPTNEHHHIAQSLDILRPRSRCIAHSSHTRCCPAVACPQRPTMATTRKIPSQPASARGRSQDLSLSHWVWPTPTSRGQTRGGPRPPIATPNATVRGCIGDMTLVRFIQSSTHFLRFSLARSGSPSSRLRLCRPRQHCRHRRVQHVARADSVLVLPPLSHVPCSRRASEAASERIETPNLAGPA